MCPENWRVTSFELDQFSKTSQADQFDQHVSYGISLAHPSLPPSSEGEVLWFQHAFGMWGRETDTFVQLVTEAKKRNAKVIATFHTIHFESDETQSGMCRKEEDLMNVVLPLLDVATVFSDGAYQALSKALPRYKNKIVVLRHGVHLYPWVSLEGARDKLLGYLTVQSNLPSSQKRELRGMYEDFFSPATIVLGNHGFISPDKDPLTLYQLGRLIRDRFPTHRVIALYIGKVPKRRDRKTEDSIEILQSLKSIHDGRENLFFEDYLPEDILPYAYRSLDFCIFWYQNATQSGRIAHAQGTGTCVVGRRIEGIGETLDSAGLPSAVSLEDLAEKIGQLILQPDQKKEMERLSKQYAERYSFAKQAQKHLLLASAARSRETLPALDRTKPDVTFILPRLALASRSGLEGFSDDGAAFLNVSDSNDLYPIPKIYHTIPLQDGTAVPVEKMKEAVDWIKRNIAYEKVVVFCRYGKGRSASVIIAYLCAIGFNYQEALKLVASKRTGTAPLPELSRTIEVILQT
jgi:protein-tyrosine phosphatase